MKILKGYNRKQMDVSNLLKGDGIYSIDAISLALPQGVYTTFRTYEREKVLHLDDHFERLIESAKLVGMNIDIDRQLVREMIRDLLPQSSASDTRIRVQIDLTQEIGAIYLLGETLRTPSVEEYQHGVRVKTIEASRITPAAKTTQNIKLTEQFGYLDPGEQVRELILCTEDGYLLEGLSSNFFAVIENTLYTASEKILSGTTRKLVLECIGDLGYCLVLSPINKQDLPYLVEAFITSVSRGILPVRKIDAFDLGDPGEITKSLMSLYQHKVYDGLENI